MPVEAELRRCRRCHCSGTTFPLDADGFCGACRDRPEVKAVVAEERRNASH